MKINLVQLAVDLTAIRCSVLNISQTDDQVKIFLGDPKQRMTIDKSKFKGYASIMIEAVRRIQEKRKVE